MIDRPEILVIVSRFPYPLEKGDKLRAYYQLRELAKTFEITLVAITDKPVDEQSIKAVRKHCEQIIIQRINWFSKSVGILRSLINGLPFQVGYFYRLSISRTIKQIIKEKDFKHIYCQLVRCSEYIKNIHTIPKTIDYMDALSAGVERRIEKQSFYRKWVFRSEAERLKKYERHIFDYFEHHTIISEQDKALIHHPDKQKIHCVPNGIESSFFEDLFKSQEFDFVFVGNMSYPPNIEAVNYIASNILPAFNNARLLISGATPHPSVKKLASSSEQIEITGWVDDIRESYCKGKVFLAPMMIGTGMQNKLLEAMALGIPCVTTPLANNAISAKNKQEIMVGTTKEDLIDCCQQLLSNPELYQNISTQAKEMVLQKYSWESSTAKLIQLLQM